MKLFTTIFLIGVCIHSSVFAQDCGNAVQCIEDKLIELRSFEERLEQLEKTQTTMMGSIVISPDECKNLGAKWLEYERGFGRFLMSRRPTQAELAKSLGGKAEHTITINNLPIHSHTYQDVYYSIDRDPRGGATKINVPGRTGSGSHDYNNWGHQFNRTTALGGGVAAPKSIDILPPFIRVHFCVHE